MGGPDLTPPSVPPPSPAALAAAAAGLDDDEEEEQQQQLPPASQSDDDLEGDDLAAAEQQQSHLPQVFPQIEHRALGQLQQQQPPQQFRPLHTRGDLANRSNATRMLQQQKANARLHALQNSALLDENEDVDIGGGDADATEGDDGGDSSSAASDASDPLVQFNSHRNQAPPPPPSSFPSLQATEDVDQLGEDTPALVPLPPFAVPSSKSHAADAVDLTLVDSDAATALASVAAVPPSTAPQPVFEPDDWSIPRIDVSIDDFGTQWRTITQANQVQLRARGHPALDDSFELLGLRWRLDVYPLRYPEDLPGKHTGAYVKLMGYADGREIQWNERPNVAFRIIALHRDVIAENQALNARACEQARMAHAASGSLEPFVPPLLWLPPSNDERNVWNERVHGHLFRQDEDFGFPGLISHQVLRSFLHGPRHTLTLRVLMEFARGSDAAVRAPERKLTSFLPSLAERTGPGGVAAAPLPQWPYAGLRNQGATCYMNSFLQTLFHLPALRRRVYDIPLDIQSLLELMEPSSTSSPTAAAGGGGAVSSRFAASPSPPVVKTSITLALQHLFYLMQTTGTGKPVSTSTLTKSFGWDGAQAFQQHDVQEFSRVLLDNLDETLSKCVPKQAPLTSLFEGQQQMYIECVNVSYASTRVESFLDLSLNVRNSLTLERSFREYVAVERMEGVNQYRAKDAAKGIDFGMQDARKGIRFLKFPQVLQLQLKRFDFSTGEARKVDDRLEYPARLDLRELEHGALRDPSDPKSFSGPDPDDPAIYHLHSVLVHKGVLGGGHYYAFIRPFLKANAGEEADAAGGGDDGGAAAVDAYEQSPWFKFDDGDVSICADSEQALARSYGGKYTEVVTKLGRKHSIDHNNWASAYMLMYVREKLVRNHGLAPAPTMSSESEEAQQANGHAPAAASAAAAAISEVPASAVASAEPMETKEGDAAAAAAASFSRDGADGTDASMEPAAGERDSDLPIPLLRPRLHRAPSCYTADPADVSAFIRSLQPVDVPLPPVIQNGFAEARRVRQQRAEQAAMEAAKFKIEVTFEKDILWQGLKVASPLPLKQEGKDAESAAEESKAAVEAQPQGGVAGLDLTCAPPFNFAHLAPLALRDFVFRRPIRPFILQRTDTLFATRARLAEQYGVPAERLQLWRIGGGGGAKERTPLDPRRVALTYLSNLRTTLEQEEASDAGHAVGSAPLQLFVRDTGWIDEQAALQQLASNSRLLTEQDARSLMPQFESGAGHGARVLLLFKFFDVSAQRMVHLGSGVLRKCTSIGELKVFLETLLASRGVQVQREWGQRPLTRVQRFEQIEGAVLWAAVSAPASSAATAGGDAAAMTDDAAASNSSAAARYPIPQLASRPDVSASDVPGAAAPPLPAGTDSDVQLIEAVEIEKPSPDEQRWQAWKERRTAETAAAAAAVPGGSPQPTPLSAAESAAQFESAFFKRPLRLAEESECVWSHLDAASAAADEAKKSAAVASNSATQQVYTHNSLAQTEAAKRREFVHRLASALQRDESTLRDCGLSNGSVLLISQSCTVEEEIAARKAYRAALERYQRRGGDTNITASVADAAPMETDEFTSAAAATASSSSSVLTVKQPQQAKSARRQPKPTSPSPSPAPSVPASATANSPTLRPALQRHFLANLPPAPMFHSSARDYVHYLMQRFLLELKPAVLNLHSFVRVPLDPSCPSHAAHPLSCPAARSLVVEVVATDSVDKVRQQLSDKLSSSGGGGVPSDVLHAYPQLRDPDCFKLWRASKLHPGTVHVMHGDCTKRVLNTNNTDHTNEPRMSVVQALILGDQGNAAIIEQSLSRDQVHTLFYELSAWPLSQLETHWCLPLQFVDERGGVHRLPSRYPALVEHEPLLFPKDKPLNLRGLHKLIYKEFVVCEQHRLQLDHLEMLDEAGQVISSQSASSASPAASAAAAGSAAEIGQKRAASADGAESGEPSTKKQRGEGASDVGAASASTGASVARARVSIANMHLGLYVPDALPLVAPRRNWLNPAEKPPALMAHFLYLWHSNNTSNVNHIIMSHVARFFRTPPTTPTPTPPVGASLAAASSSSSSSSPVATASAAAAPLPPSVARHPKDFTDSHLPLSHFTQQLPFALTVWCQPKPSAAEASALAAALDGTKGGVAEGDLSPAHVFRFTAFKSADLPLPAKQGYAFSPLPPLLTFVDSEEDTPLTFRARLSKQMGCQTPKDIQLALLTPKHYELIEPDATTAAVAVGVINTEEGRPRSPSFAAKKLFAAWAQDSEGPNVDVRLGLFDATTPHTLNTSQNQLDAKAMNMPLNKSAGALSFSRSSNGLSIKS